jgi:tetratricopeptide (TPR) repeat protein
LLAIPLTDLARVDIARANLLCAEGLPGSEMIDVSATLARLDDWALLVARETERHLYRLHDPRYADHYRRSEAYLRVSFLLQTLQEDCGVRYDPAGIYSPDFSDSRSAFIHGTFDPARGGTCASLPVLYVAVGRRLGYPMHVVRTRGHVFCRWDAPGGERLNIEGTNGFTAYPDDFYRRWPWALSPEDEQSGEYLVALTPAQEVALFMAARGHTLFDVGQYRAAAYAYGEALRLAPEFISFKLFYDAAQLVAKKGLAEYERLHGVIPKRLEPPPIPEGFLPSEARSAPKGP